MEHPPVRNRTISPDLIAIEGSVPVPGLGILPVNAHVLVGPEPVVVDTGVTAFADAYLDGIAAAVDLEDIRWIYLTHTDPDHTGCLRRLLELAPKARLVTTFLGMGKLGLNAPIDPERTYLLNPGQELVLPDRRLRATSLPCYDAPETTGLFDSSRGVLFSADCFGAVLASLAERAEDVPAEDLTSGMTTWTMVDAPWLPELSEASFEARVQELLRLEPQHVLGSHLPEARDLPALLRRLRGARKARPFVGPDQAALEASLHAL